MNPLFAHYKRAFDECLPYLLTTEPVRPLLERSPLGISLEKRGIILDAQRRANVDFLHLLQGLDRLTFGPLEMTIPKWMSYDAGIMPSGIFGFCSHAHRLPQWVRQALGVSDDYEGLVPLTPLIDTASPFVALFRRLADSPSAPRGCRWTSGSCTTSVICLVGVWLRAQGVQGPS